MGTEETQDHTQPPPLTEASRAQLTELLRSELEALTANALAAGADPQAIADELERRIGLIREM